MLVLFFSILAFAIVLIISYQKKSLRLLNEDAAVKHPFLLLLLNFSGILFLGILPAFFLSFPDFDFRNLSFTQISVLIGLVLLTTFTAYKVANKDLSKTTFAVDPKILSFSFLSAYFILRILFIIAYEIWFRGYFLDFCVAEYGEIIAIVINIALYAILHLVNGKREALSCIPFGFILCAMSIWFQSPLPAIAIHLALTVPYDIMFIIKKSQK